MINKVFSQAYCIYICYALYFNYLTRSQMFVLPLLTHCNKDYGN